MKKDLDNLDNQINNLSPDAQDVANFIKRVIAPETQEGFSRINQNPSAVRKLNIEEIKIAILGVLEDRGDQEKFKAGLQALSSLDKYASIYSSVANDIGKLYNEMSGDNPSPFSQDPEREAAEFSVTESNGSRGYQESDTTEFSVTESNEADTPTKGNPLPWRISELTRNNTPMMTKDVIHTLSRWLHVDIFQYSPEKIRGFIKGYTPDHMLHKICNDFTNLEPWKKEMLQQYVLKGYYDKSNELSFKLQLQNISDFTVLHRSILDELVKSYQDVNSPESNLYYLSGLKDNRIMVSTDSLGPLENIIEDAELLDGISAFFADKANKPVNPEAKNMDNKGREENIERRRNELKKKIQVIVDHKIYAGDLGISTLLPGYKNAPASFIEAGDSFAIPVEVSGIDTSAKQKIFKKLFPEFNQEAGLPNWFDIGYLIGGSNIGIKDGMISISSGRSRGSGVHPVILYNNIAIIVHNFGEFREMTSNAPVTNFISMATPSLTEGLARMFHAMFLNTENLYKPLIDRTKSSIRTEYKTKYPDQDTEPKI